MNTPCALCGRHDVTPLYLVGERHIVRCNHDGLVYVDPQPTAATLNRWYNEGYFTDKKREKDDYLGYFSYLDEKPLLIPYFKRKLAYIKKYIPTGTLLEVGCGYGFFLEAANTSAFQVTGIDVSKDAVTYAKQHGSNARVLSLTKQSFPKNAFSGVVAFQLIEHLQHPLEFLEIIHDITKPGGIVLFTTPNEGGYLKKMLGKRWMGFRHREHLYFFSPNTIRHLLIKAGFVDITTFGDEVRTYPIRFLLAGAPNYLHGAWFRVVVSFITKVLGIFSCLDIMVPLPLNSLVIAARKPSVS